VVPSCRVCAWAVVVVMMGAEVADFSIGGFGCGSGDESERWEVRASEAENMGR
jgi:hypothetical protein